MYGTGQGIPMDHAEAVRWYRLAADQGHAEAQRYLGIMYRFGVGLGAAGRASAIDRGEAVRWFRLAADQGLASAQNDLGFMYGTGAGVPQDDVQAHMWANIAASRSTGEDRERSVGLRDQIADELTPDDLSEAQRRAREWDAAHPREP